MNATVARLTAGTLLGRRRALLLLLLPMVLLALCLLARVLGTIDPDAGTVLEQGRSVEMLSVFGLGTLLPLLGVIAGTGAIGPEIDDGSIVYLLSKPLSRSAIVASKLVVAIGVVMLFGAVPVVLGGVILTGELGRVAFAFGAGSLVAGIVYCTSFLLLAVLTRNAVVIGLLYAMIWESLIGQFVPGAQALSIQQWSLALVERGLGDVAGPLGVGSAVSLPVGASLLAAVAVGCTWYAGRRLRTLRLSDDA